MLNILCCAIFISWYVFFFKKSYKCVQHLYISDIMLAFFAKFIAIDEIYYSRRNARFRVSRYKWINNWSFVSSQVEIVKGYCVKFYLVKMLLETWFKMMVFFVYVKKNMLLRYPDPLLTYRRQRGICCQNTTPILVLVNPLLFFSCFSA